MQGKHMNWLFRIPRRYILLVCLLIVGTLLLFLGSPGTIRAASATIVTHQVVGPEVPVGQTGTVSVSCASGEQLLGGGFYGYAFEQAAYITGSYPSAADTWTVTVDNTIAPSYVEVTAYVYCLQADYSLATTIVQAANSGSGLITASCPAASTLISGGHSGSKRSVTTSAPDGNGWQTDDGTAYAICATQNVTSTSLVSAVFTTPANSTASGATASCASGQYASGGGFSGPTTNSVPVYLSHAGSENISWSVGAGGTGQQNTITVWAVCTSLSGVAPPPVTPTVPVVTPTTPVVTPTTPVITPTTPPSPIQITYQLVSEWQGGFTAIIKICNTGSQPISGWILRFTFPGDQHITQAWNGTVSQSGEQVTIINASYNGFIAPGQCITIGFNGTWKNNDASPTSFTFNSLVADPKTSR